MDNILKYYGTAFSSDIIENYGRGAGYTSRKTCNHHSKTGCEKCGALFYPKCRNGY